MALRKPTKSTYPQVYTNYNESSDLNPSREVDYFTNYINRTITLETVDQAVWQEFNNRFTIAQKQIGLISLDSEISTMQEENIKQYDQLKQYLNFPIFTFWRTNTGKEYRVSPTNKMVMYAIPKKKAQGTVYEEYITPPPTLVKLTYEFKFLTTYRDHTNTFEQYMNEYFKNKRNIILFEQERFEIQPSNANELGTLDTVEREGSSGQSLYVLTYQLIVSAYLRDAKQVQKRERPNTYSLRITERTNNIVNEIQSVETNQSAQESKNQDKRELE